MPDLMTHSEAARIAKLMREPVEMNEADVRAIATSKGVLAVAIADIVLRFPNDGSIALATWLDEIKSECPHYWPPRDEADDIGAALVEAACGSKPTLSSRAALHKAAGPALYSRLLAAWGCDERTLTPGKNPKAAAKNEAARDQRRVDHANNPFHRLNWNISKQGALVKAIGLDKANEIARSVGSHVGATRPSAEF